MHLSHRNWSLNEWTASEKGFSGNMQIEVEFSEILRTKVDAATSLNLTK